MLQSDIMVYLCKKLGVSPHENTLEIHIGRNLCLYGRQMILKHSFQTPEAYKSNTKVARTQDSLVRAAAGVISLVSRSSFARYHFVKIKG